MGKAPRKIPLGKGFPVLTVLAVLQQLGRNASPITGSRLFITDTRKLLEWEDLGPALPKGDVWPGSGKKKGCHRAVLTYATGTTPWVELTILNWQKDLRAQSFPPQVILQSVPKSN